MSPAKNRINRRLIGITIAGVLGNLVGSLIVYFTGLKGGRSFLEL